MKPQRVMMLVVFVAAASLFFAGCELFAATYFPPGLTRMQALVNIWDFFPELKGVTDYDIVVNEVRGSKENVAVFVEYKGKRIVALLDARTLQEERILTAENLSNDLPSSTYGFMSAVVFGSLPNGMYAIGQHQYDPLSGKFIADLTDLHDSFSVCDAANALFVCVSAAKADLYYTGVSTMEYTLIPSYSYMGFPTPMETRMKSGAYIDGSVRLLLAYRLADSSTSLAISDPYAWSLPSSMNFTPLDIDRNFDLYESRRHWLTADGIIVLSNSDKSTQRITRYSLSGAERDSFPTAKGDNVYTFMQDGKTFYQLDKRTGRLSKLKTWWK